jgi:hypothetical protein
MLISFVYPLSDGDLKKNVADYDRTFLIQCIYLFFLYVKFFDRAFLAQFILAKLFERALNHHDYKIK